MLKKVIIIILVLVSILGYLSNNAYAMDNVISGGDSFLAAANGIPIDENELSKTSNYIYNILFTIAVVLAFAIGMVIGIQFMLGSAEEQAKVKETLVPYVIGVFIVFASFTIWKIVVNIGNNVTPAREVRPTNTELDGKYDSVFSVTLSQIDSMNKNELENYLDKILEAIRAQEALSFNQETLIVENNEKITKLQERKAYVAEKINSLPIEIPDYQGPESEYFKNLEEKYKNMLENP